MNWPLFNYTKRKEELVDTIIIFIYTHLCKWRDSPVRTHEENEQMLNADLIKFLINHCGELPVCFFHEELQGNNRTVDFSVIPLDTAIYNETIAVFECKRLSTETGRERKDEYVTGHNETTGGIQRFKLEAHGKKHKIVGMIGYVQTGTIIEWEKTINKCIDSLCGKQDENDLFWDKREHLNAIEHDEKNGTYHGKSTHTRKTTPDITIHHLWVNMQKNTYQRVGKR